MADLHIILCQNTQQKDWLDMIVLKRVSDTFQGKVIPHYYQKRSFRMLNTWERIVLIVKSMLSTKRGDFIFLQGGGLIWIMLLMLVVRRRNVIYWNLIFYTNIHTFKNAFFCKLLMKANRKGNFFATVNAKELQQIYSEVFDCDDRHFPLVYDPMEISDTELGEKYDKGYVFFGGRARRDTDCFEQIVSKMPELEFVAVIPSNMVTKRMLQMKNLKIYSDIPSKEFYELLSHSSICCIPLKSKEPCGLYVMQHAILMGIPIVSTETYSMRTIIPDDSCGFLCKIGDAITMTERIRQIVCSPLLRETLTNNAIANMKKQFSNDAVAQQMVKAFQNIANYCESEINH